MLHFSFNKFRCQVRLLPALAGFLLLYGCGGPPTPKEIPVKPPDGPAARHIETGEMEGKVTGFDDNPSGDIDRMKLDAATGDVWFHFPPHLARNVMAIAVKNARVTVRYEEGLKRKPDGDDPLLEMIYLRSDDSRQTFSLDKVPPPPPRPGSVIKLEGRPTPGDSAGRTRFFVLAGKRIALSPRSAETLLPIIAASTYVIVTGEERDSSDGFVSLSGLPYVRARQLTIDNVNYIIE